MGGGRGKSVPEGPAPLVEGPAARVGAGLAAAAAEVDADAVPELDAPGEGEGFPSSRRPAPTKGRNLGSSGCSGSAGAAAVSANQRYMVDIMDFAGFWRSVFLQRFVLRLMISRMGNVVAEGPGKKYLAQYSLE